MWCRILFLLSIWSWWTCVPIIWAVVVDVVLLKVLINSHCLMPAEQNYDPGNLELLAVVLALQEWQHWLEGVAHPSLSGLTTRICCTFTDWRLTSRQASWELLMGRFCFSLTYHATPRSIKPGALSQYFSTGVKWDHRHHHRKWDLSHSLSSPVPYRGGLCHRALTIIGHFSKRCTTSLSPNYLPPWRQPISW